MSDAATTIVHERRTGGTVDSATLARLAARFILDAAGIRTGIDNPAITFSVTFHHEADTLNDEIVPRARVEIVEDLSYVAPRHEVGRQ
ncbi:hypothetical protein [Ancylobacter moscoviensis]